MDYLVLAYYMLSPIENPDEEVTRQKEFLGALEATGRIYISPEGINCQMSGTPEAVYSYMDWLTERGHQIDFKLQSHGEQAFPSMIVKTRPELVAMGVDVDLSQRGVHVSPRQWREMLESDEEYLCIDVRNDYEWDVGHFQGFERPSCTTFKEFPAYTQKLKSEVDPKKTKVMMCCTGGIRCEFYSAYLKQEGFEEIYQLDGGIIAYGEQEQGRHFEGKLFVFDDRLAVEINAVNGSVTGKCLQCGVDADHPFNCANMDCNRLFLVCDDCLCDLKGCCSPKCQSGPRVRPYHHQSKHKPFRRWYHYIAEDSRMNAEQRQSKRQKQRSLNQSHAHPAIAEHFCSDCHR